MVDSRARGSSRYLTPASPEDTDNVTPPGYDLMELLERNFPVHLPHTVQGIEDIALDVAIQEGQQQVLTFLRNLRDRNRG